MTYEEAQLSFPAFQGSFKGGIFYLLLILVPANRVILNSSLFSSWGHSILMFRFCQGYYEIIFHFVGMFTKFRIAEAKIKRQVDAASRNIPLF